MDKTLVERGRVYLDDESGENHMLERSSPTRNICLPRTICKHLYLVCVSFKGWTFRLPLKIPR
jgi:hypothetical protein